MAALQQSPVALHSKSPPFKSPAQASSSISLRSSSSISAFHSLRFRLLPALRSSTSRRRGRSASGATMMDTAAGSYAAALSDVAKSNGTLEATSGDMEKVAKIFSDPAVVSFFTNPTIEAEKKQKLIDEMGSSSSLQPHTVNFLNIVVDMKRTELIGEIVKEFEVRYNQITGTEVAVVTSVVNLESQHLAQIAKAVQRLTGAKNVRIKTAIDESLVAGFTIRYGPSGSKLIDMSVRKQLDEIARQLEFNVELVAA